MTVTLDLKKIEGKLKNIYDQYESEAAEFKKQAVCGIGCSFCCSFMGNIDIVTLEGIILKNKIETMLEFERASVNKGLAKDRDLRGKGKKTPCPFLDSEGACRIYDVRPFSCRQLYSLRKCEEGGPMVHKQAVMLARRTVRQIQQLDNAGYSGHLSFILKLLDNLKFREKYLVGKFDPGSIQKFGKKHGIIINRFAK